MVELAWKGGLERLGLFMMHCIGGPIALSRHMARNETVLITGGTGNIGEALCRRLGNAYRIVAVDLKPPSSQAPILGIQYLQMDVSSRESVHKTLEEVRRKFGPKISSVIHLAAYYSFSGQPSPKYDEITVRGSQNLIEELSQFDIEQFIFSSTMLVHAPQHPPREIDEESPVVPSWPYPESKVKAEAVLKRGHGPIPIVNLRIAGVYDDNCHSIPIANHIKRIYEKQLTSHFFPGDPTHGQAFVHMDDLVEAIRLVIEKRKELPGETTLLIGEDEAFSFEMLQNEIARLLYGKSWATLWIPEWMAKAGSWAQNKAPFMQEPFIKPWMIPFADDHYDLDIRKARQLLGWEPKHSLRDTLPRMIQSLKNDPERWYRENKLQLPRRRPRQAA